MGNGAGQMRLPPAPHTNMPYTKQSQELGLEDTPMDKVKKLLKSPVAGRKKPASNGLPSNGAIPQRAAMPGAVSPGMGYFGVELEKIRQREGRDIPKLVTKICEYIHATGLEIEGVFRVNGNQRIVEKLRASFDQTGDADLEEGGDIMAVAGLLKLFLRELPVSLIPEPLTAQFVKAQEEYARDKQKCIEEIKLLLKELPRIHYCTLKYLSKFLVVVAKREEDNKMSPMALGIVFGPNVFRCTAGIQGLREQGITNHITLKFITDYDAIFLQKGELSPYSPKYSLVLEGKKRKAPAPPRPPPPRVEGVQGSPPVPSPRKQKLRREALPIVDMEDMETSEKSSSATPRSQDVSTPRISEDEFLDSYRSSSPLILESDRSECGTVTSTLLNQGTSAADTAVVEKVICSAISEHLFGDPGGSVSSDDSQSSLGRNSTPVPAPRRRRRGKESPEGAESSDGDDLNKLSVKQRINQLQSDPTDFANHDTKPRKQKPTSNAFAMFESKGIIIGPAPGSLSKPSGALTVGPRVHVRSDEDSDQSDHSLSSRPVPKPRSPRKRHASPERQPEVKSSEPTPPSVHIPGQDVDISLSSIQQGHERLTSFKRVQGPKNRRSPSRHSLSRQYSSEEPVPDPGGYNTRSPDGGPPKPREFLAEDENHNATKIDSKPRIGFLDLHSSDPGDDSQSSPEKSPTVARKPYVPPLDLSILHEHGDGSEPIPAHEGPSISLQKGKNLTSDNSAMLSPRMSKMKKNNSAQYDTDVPPSPPMEQLTLFTKRGKNVDDDYSTQIKQLTKKIQTYKRKIKIFEETFEDEHGYRPSQMDKAARSDIKKCMQELAKSRKELRHVTAEVSPHPGSSLKYSHTGSMFNFDHEVIGKYHSSGPPTLGAHHSVKDEIEQGRHFAENQLADGQGSAISSGSSTKDGGTPTSGATMEVTLKSLLKRLHEKRLDNERPEGLTEMSRGEIHDEKIAVQKALLHFEGQHGRPTTKTEKELMRPLYDRYRNIKRILSKPLSPRDPGQELQPVPEDQTIEFATTPSTSKSSNRDPIQVPTGVTTGEDQEGEGEEFMVTHDFGLLKQTVKPDDSYLQVHVDVSPPDSDMKRNLHKLTVSQLFEEQQKAKNDKKQLRKILRKFEDDFFQQTGRKVQKEDRAPMETEYYEYKQVKAKMKLLEALVSKHDPMGTL